MDTIDTDKTEMGRGLFERGNGSAGKIKWEILMGSCFMGHL
jgi:hypothetical protein